MSTQSQELEAVVARVERLEQANRRLKKVFAVVLIVAVMGLLMGQAKLPAAAHGDDQGRKVIRAATIAAESNSRRQRANSVV